MNGWNSLTAEKRKLQGASGDHEVDVAIADGEKADAVCQTDDVCINDLKGNTIQNLWKELNNMQNEQRPHKKNWLNLKSQFEKDVEKKLTQLMDEKQQLECKVTKQKIQV